MSQSPQSLAPVRSRLSFSGRVIALGARLWHIIGWIWSTVIVGGFLVGLLISYLLTGTSGLPNSDPRTWFIVRTLLAYPLVTAIVLIATLLITLGCYFAARREKREQQGQQSAHEESLIDISRGVRDMGRGVLELLEERRTQAASMPGAASSTSTVSTHADTSPPAKKDVEDARPEAESRTLGGVAQKHGAEKRDLEEPLPNTLRGCVETAQRNVDQSV